MDPTRIDRLATFFADRRLSRRQAVRQGAAGLAAGAIAATGLRAAAGVGAAQDATPAAGTEKGEHDPTFLFVQSFRSGSLAPQAGSDDTFTLTLDQGLGQTIYFSDRPERIVGAAPTPQFLDGLGFSPENPPNAALVVETAAGETEIAVVELINPVYHPSGPGVTYDVTALAEWEAALGVGLTQTPADLAAFGAEFGAAHLFIDDCADWGHCLGQMSSPIPKDVGTLPGGPVGACWSWDNWVCKPSNCGDNTDYDAICKQAYKSLVDEGFMVYAGP